MRQKGMTTAAGSVVLAAVLGIGLRLSRSSIETEDGTETRVSESRQYGKHVRTTEVLDGDSILSQVREVSINDDGRIDVVFTKLFRDGEMIFASSSYKYEKRTIRGYYHNDRLAVQEGDEDGDGFFETLILYDEMEQPVEGFSRSQNGKVTQFSEERLAELRRSFEKFQE